MQRLKLLELELENWAVHSKRTVSLEGSLQIEGRNGTGKSSILEAIRFVFAKDAKGYKNRIRNGCKGAKVRLSFEYSGSQYRIEKSLNIQAASTAQLIIDSKIAASNPSEVYSRLQEILPENIIEKLLYVPQDGLVELIEKLRIKGGREELDELLGLDRFKRVYDGVNQELRDKENVLKGLSNGLGEKPREKEREYIEKIEKERREKNVLEEKIDARKTALRDLESAFGEIEKQVQSMRYEKKKKEELLKKASNLEIKTAESKAELSALEKSLSLLEDKKKELEELRIREKALERFSEIKEPLNMLILLDGRLKEPPEAKSLRKEIETLEESLNTRGEYEKDRELLRKEIDDLKRKKTGLDQRIEDIREYMRNLKGMENKAKCPKCGQSLTQEHMEYELGESERKEKEFEYQAEELRKKLFEAKKSESELENTFCDLQKKENKIGQLAEKVKEKEKLEKEINELGVRLIDSGYAGEPIEEVNAGVDELNKSRGRINALESDLRKEKEHLEEIGKIHKTLSEMESEREKLNSAAEGIECNEALLEGLEKDRDALQRGVFEGRNTLSLALQEIGHRNKELDTLNAMLAELRSSMEKEENLGREIKLFGEARDIFHTNKGIVKYLREMRVAELNKRMSHYFRMFNQNPKYRDVGFDKEYSIRLDTTEGELGVDQLSGGEKVQLAIALRVALITLLSNNMKILILDEPFGSLDEEHREVLGEALNRIARDWQLILVTHINVDSLNLLRAIELDSY